VLLKNAGSALPLDAAKTKKIAVVGPLADTLYTDWYSGTMPYQVTPLDGIRQRSPGATVTSSEGIDRIALREVTTGRYLTATGTTDADPVRATATDNADPAAQFDVADWGESTVTLRSVANGKYVGYNWTPFITRDDQPNSWFTQQQFSLEEQAGGEYLIRYIGYETREPWFGANRYITIAADGTMALGAATAENAARFAREEIKDGVAEAVAAVTGADAAVVVVGSMPLINGRETDDRHTLALAPGQEELVKAVRRANPKTVVVLENSYPTSITWAQDNVPAILWTTHAGQETGTALASALFGDHNPSGRLTQTWYASDSALPDILDYDIAKTGMTYLYYRGRPLYPFGHGLSYTRFTYKNLRLAAASIPASGSVTATVDVTNAGRRAGTETVQLYTHQRQSRVQQPVKQLRAFQKVTLAPGQTKRVSFRLAARDLAFWDVTRSRPVVEDASHDIAVGASAADVRQTATLRVRGERIPLRDLRTTTAAWTYDDYSGTTLVDTTKAAGTAVAATAPGQWVKFAGVRLGGSRVTARVATPGDAAATIQVRLGHPTNGRLLGTIAVPATGGRYAWTTVSASLREARGAGDVYLTFTAPAVLDQVSMR
jgi:beta-glucosidase